MQKRMVKNVKLKIYLNYRTSKEYKLSHNVMRSSVISNWTLLLEVHTLEALWKGWVKLRRDFLDQADIVIVDLKQPSNMKDIVSGHSWGDFYHQEDGIWLYGQLILGGQLIYGKGTKNI